MDSSLEDFYNALTPCQYEFISAPGKTRFGFVAQEVIEALERSGLSAEQTSLVHNGFQNLSLAYLEFIALNTWQIQKLKTQITQLEERLKALESK